MKILSFFCIYLLFVQESEQKSKEIEVVFFLSEECPIARKYIKSLCDLADDSAYSNVKFVGYLMSANSVQDVNQFKNEFHISRNIRLGVRPKKVYVRKVGATITPEVFVFFGERVVYQGAIDNWFYSLGRSRSKPTEYYLRDALNAILQGANPKIVKTLAVGCFIE